MRQVPRYLIVGRGRLASHIMYYFQLLELNVRQWHRDSSECISDLIKTADVVMVLISDSELEHFIKQHLGASVRFVHCSGSLYFPDTLGMHPLMTFANTFYKRDVYEAFPFAVDGDVDVARKYFPHLKNKFIAIKPKDKALYHALCVMSGNFTVILWQKYLKEMHERWGVSQSDLMPYMQTQFDNILRSPESALTGPLARSDEQTLTKNMCALEGDPFQAVYKTMLDAYQKEQANEVDK